MRIKFWGVRGSIPTPGESTVRYGGNTACTELHLDAEDSAHRNGNLIILDAGTGIRNLGNQLMKDGKNINAHILITHPHWDHIQGFPFFRPAFVPGNKLTIVGPEAKGVKLAELIAEQMNKIYFPVNLSELEAEIDFIPMKEDTINVQGAKVQSFFVNHPGFTIGYRISYNNKSLAYVSDNEPFSEETAHLFTNGEAEVLKLFREYHGDPNDRVRDFIKGVDVLIHDTTYTPEQYGDHIGWGHSHYLHTLRLAFEAGVKTLFLFHYDPSLTDKDVDDMVARSNREMKKLNYSFKLCAAKEGLEFKF
ncbi:MAG TPA: MBL fold metallo-hydrolase [Candidatus Acidoferrales bacterium]|nr:MBL fold metallo-hydrolase [Candidatus Acidoferrales bacterium]